jgi:hypothetical protein
MKYIEELEIGEAFLFENQRYINTADFKKNGSRLAVNIKTGNNRWLKRDDMVESIDIYFLDESSNFVAVTERPKPDAIITT